MKDVTTLTALHAKMTEVLRRDAADSIEDTPMRVSIILSQLGDLARYVTHDERLFPEQVKPRPHGNRRDEVSTYGHCIIQIVALAVERGVSAHDLEEGVRSAVGALDKIDWADVRSLGRGAEVASPGTAEGCAWHFRADGERPEGPIVVLAGHLQAKADLPQGTVAILTEQGSTESHAAHMAKDRNIPCVVGITDALTRWSNGARLRIRAIANEPPIIELA